MDSKGKEDSSYIPWKFKRQRPDKVPGFQDVSRLPELPEGQTFCAENEKCFYFSCAKCSSHLALDILNPGYETSMQYIPRITCILRPEVFQEDNKYHGEIFEIYLKYFAQMSPALTGIAINGWSSLHAAKIFHNVEETFKSSKKFETSRDFEIDWILFNESTITVIEVKEVKVDEKKQATSSQKNENIQAELSKNDEKIQAESSKEDEKLQVETSKKEKNYEKKLDQIKKDDIILKHLLEVTKCKNVRVNYVIACPNSSITEVQNGTFLQNHIKFLLDITSNGNTMSFISAECMADRHVYQYNRDTKGLDDIEFLQLIQPKVEKQPSAPVGHFKAKFSASSLVISMLMIGGNVDERNEHLCPGNYNFELKQSKLNKELNIPKEDRADFPQCLVLGPEQMEVIRSKSRRRLIIGEAGCGKTQVLLYLLFKYTAKRLNEIDTKGVTFCIGKEKVHLRKILDQFIDKYCHSEFVEVVSSIKDCKLDDGKQIILIDEIYIHERSGQELKDEIDLNVSCVAEIVAVIGFQVALNCYHINEILNWEGNWTLFTFRESYRCPVNISMRCMKLNQQENIFYGSAGTSKILLPRFLFSVSFGSGVHVNDEDSFQIVPHTGDIDRQTGRLELADWKLADPFAKKFPTESMLLVTDIEELLSSPQFKDYSEKELLDDEMETSDLPFTGVEYHTVVIILKDRSQLHTSQSEFTYLLYQSMSRAVFRVILVCHQNEVHFYTKLCSLHDGDLHVIHRLKRSQSVCKQNFSKIRSSNQWKEVLFILIATKNIDMFKNIKNLLLTNLKVSEILLHLVQSFPWGQNGEILEMMGMIQNLADLTALIDTKELLESLEIATYYLYWLPNVSVVRDLWKKFKKAENVNLLNLFLVSEKTHIYHRFSAASFVLLVRSGACSVAWHDREWFKLVLDKIRAVLQYISSHSANCADELPKKQKEQSNANVHPLQVARVLIKEKADRFFEEYSSLTENGKLKFSVEQIDDNFWRVIFDDDFYKNILSTHRSKLRELPIIVLEKLLNFDDMCRHSSFSRAHLTAEESEKRYCFCNNVDRNRKKDSSSQTEESYFSTERFHNSVKKSNFDK